MLTIIAFIKAIPTLDGWFQDLVSLFLQIRVSEIKKENLDAIRTTIQNHDQRALEKAVGSATVGKPSGDAGAVITDGTPPNVMI